MFDLAFFYSLLVIIAIDIVLGGDNAVVIAMASRKLPVDQKKKAIIGGTMAAIVIRVIATVFAALLLDIPYLFLVGGILLTWIAYKLLVDEDEKKEIKPGDNLFHAIRTIVIADVLMGLDNVLAIAGAAKGHSGELFLIVTGLLISVPIMIWGSGLILLAMERHPWILYVGSGILALTAAKMITHEKIVNDFLGSPWLIYGFDLLLVAAVIFIGYRVRTSSHKKKQQNEQTQDKIATEL